MEKVEIFNPSRFECLQYWKMPKSNLNYPLYHDVNLSSLMHAQLEEEIRELNIFFEEVYEMFLPARRLIWVIDPMDAETLEYLLKGIQNVYLEAIYLVQNSITNESEIDFFHFASSVGEALELVLEAEKHKRFDGGGELENHKELVRNIHFFSAVPPDCSPLVLETHIDRIQNATVGYFVLSGFHGNGSENNAQISIVNRRLNQFLARFDLDFLVVDASRLDYNWGDKLQLYPVEYRYTKLTESKANSLLFIISPEQQESPEFMYLFRVGEDRIVSSDSEAAERITHLIKGSE